MYLICLGCLSWHHRVSGTDNSLTSSGILFRVSSFTFHTSSNTLLFPDAFSKKGNNPPLILTSEFGVALVASRPEDAFIDLLPISI